MLKFKEENQVTTIIYWDLMSEFWYLFLFLLGPIIIYLLNNYNFTFFIKSLLLFLLIYTVSLLFTKHQQKIIIDKLSKQIKYKNFVINFSNIAKISLIRKKMFPSSIFRFLEIRILKSDNSIINMFAFNKWWVYASQGFIHYEPQHYKKEIFDYIKQKTDLPTDEVVE